MPGKGKPYTAKEIKKLSRQQSANGAKKTNKKPTRKY